MTEGLGRSEHICTADARSVSRFLKIAMLEDQLFREVTEVWRYPSKGGEAA